MLFGKNKKKAQAAADAAAWQKLVDESDAAADRLRHAQDREERYGPPMDVGVDIHLSARTTAPDGVAEDFVVEEFRKAEKNIHEYAKRSFEIAGNRAAARWRERMEADRAADQRREEETRPF